MTKTDILDWFSMNNEALSANKILFVLGMGILVASIIFVTYRITFTGVLYNAKMNVGFVVLLLIASVIMMMISSNIAISLGMVGALSIVRYRTAVKDTWDTVYIFWSIVEGLCVGAGIYKLAFFSTIVISLIFVSMNVYCKWKKKYLIIIRGKGSLKADTVLKCIKEKYKKPCFKSANYGKDHCEFVVEVTSTNEISSEVMEKIRENPDVLSVNWILEMGEHIG